MLKRVRYEVSFIIQPETESPLEKDDFGDNNHLFNFDYLQGTLHSCAESDDTEDRHEQQAEWLPTELSPVQALFSSLDESMENHRQVSSTETLLKDV